jgi:hypothetical protein
MKIVTCSKRNARMILVLISFCSGNYYSFAQVSTCPVKWQPGIYVKPEEWQLANPSQLATIYNELSTTPGLKGIKLVLHWGDYEKKRGVYDFSAIDTYIAQLKKRGKYLMLAVAWKNFGGNDTVEAGRLIPGDMRKTTGIYKPGQTEEHMTFQYLWADAPSGFASGYNLKLWDTTLISRLDEFLAALAEHLDADSTVVQIATLESALGTPIVPFGTGTPGTPSGTNFEASNAKLDSGRIKVVRLMRSNFKYTPTTSGLNFDRPFVKAAVALLENEKIGLGSPNSNKQPGLITTGNPPGVLTYYPVLSGKVSLTPEIQGEEYRATNGPGTTVDWPSSEYLYLRCRNDLKANYIVCQRNFPKGRPGTEGWEDMLKFIKNYPLIVNDTTGAGGLDAQLPSNMSIPDAPNVTGVTICSGNTAKLTASSPCGTYTWYSAATGGTLLFTGASYTTPILTSTKTYYVQRNVNGYASLRTPVTVTVNICTGTGAYGNPDQLIRVFPNPADGQFTLQINAASSEQFSVSVSDVLGKVVYYEHGVILSSEYKQQINLSDLPRGVYYIKCIIGTNVKAEKIIVQ